MEMSKAKAAEMALVAAIAGIAIALPIYAGTGTYPLAIVQGNSMYPTYHNGDLVVFGKAQQGAIANRTIIVFVQGETGVSALDSIVRPVVIHRIVGTVIQADGTVLYRTKGDNNQFVDPSLTQANHVLGVPMVVVPSAGLLVLFLGSPEGLVALIGVISLYYLGKYEVKMKEAEAKDSFLGELARLLVKGEIPQPVFDSLEPIVKYGKVINPDSVEDELAASVLAWIKKGGLGRKWKVETVDCPRCSAKAPMFTSKNGDELLLCPHVNLPSETHDLQVASIQAGST